MHANEKGSVTQIIFIGGSGRSGSTLLDRLIGQLSGMTSAGEVRDLWRAGIRENRLCGCGARFHDCPFWTRVGEHAFGGWDGVDADEADRLVGSFGYREALGRPGDEDAGLRNERAALLRRLYDAITAAGDGATVIDSSKSPPYGLLLASSFPSQVSLVHLVRDPRGVAFSWAKHVARPDTPGRDVEMHRLSAPEVAARWLAHNVLMEALARRVPASRVRYETLMDRPREELARILTDIGRPPSAGDLDFMVGSNAQLRPNHTVMGNPMRMAVGDVPLRVDEAWRDGQPAFDRLVVTAMTLGLLLRYGYRP
jgi:hypothetical protein